MPLSNHSSRRRRSELPQLPGRPVVGGLEKGSMTSETTGEAALAAVQLWPKMSKYNDYTPTKESVTKHGERRLLIAGRPCSVDNATLDTEAEGLGAVLPVGRTRTQQLLCVNFEWFGSRVHNLFEKYGRWHASCDCYAARWQSNYGVRDLVERLQVCEQPMRPIHPCALHKHLHNVA